jgi:hypothetical protein
VTPPPDGDFVFVRFSPFGSEGITNNIRKTVIGDKRLGRLPPRHGLSVFGIRRNSGETEKQAVQRLCDALVGKLGGEKISVTTVAAVAAIGLTLHDDQPPPHHYLIGTQTMQDMPDVDSISGLFDDRIANPALEKEAQS